MSGEPLTSLMDIKLRR